MSRRNLILTPLIVAALALTSIALIRATQSNTWTIEKFKSQKLDWRDCYGDFECATFEVPVNYEEITDETFKLKALRHLATGPGPKLGSIVVNPGGPGGSAIDYAYNAESIVSDEINQRYDIVGFDPRGVNTSEPIRCLSDSEEDAFLGSGGSVNTRAEITALKRISKNFAMACAQAGGSKLGHYSTLDSAMDLEVLRNLLGDEKLNYLGKSYGTYLGTIYAALYPDRVGKFVLDGAVAPDISLREQGLTQAIGFEGALEGYLSASKKFIIADVTRLLLESATTPLQDSEGRKATESLVITAIAQALYNSSSWSALTRALNLAIEERDPRGIFALADSYNNRDSSGRYYSNQTDISIMISCLDWAEPRSVGQIVADQKYFSKKSPVFGAYVALASLPCKYWSAEPKVPKVKFSNLKTSPILIIGVSEDPATPYAWAEKLNKVFVDSTLLTLKGTGHTGHNRGNACIDKKVAGYFLAGKIPQSGQICSENGN